MLSARHLTVWNESLSSIMGPGFSEHDLRAAGSVDIFASHRVACRPLPNLITNCSGAGRCGDPTLPEVLSSLPTDTFTVVRAVLQHGKLDKRILF